MGQSFDHVGRGAAAGIGAATARLLASHGAVTYCADLAEANASDAGTSDAATSRTVQVQLDVRDEEAWDTAVSGVLENEGKLDVLVHAAGIAAASAVPPVASRSSTSKTRVPGSSASRARARPRSWAWSYRPSSPSSGRSRRRRCRGNR